MAKNSKKTKAPVKMFPALEVFAAACAAQRINNSYIKETHTSPTADSNGDYATIHANKYIMRCLLVGGEFPANVNWEVTTEDREQSDVVRTYFQCKLMDVLTGTASEFIRNTVEFASKEEFAANEWLALATVACLPNSYKRGLEFDRRKEVKLDATLCSQYFGSVGDKVSGMAEVIDCNFNMNWAVYFVTAKFNGNVISFTYRNQLEIGKTINFKGSIKGHRDNSITQLTRVRIE